MVALNIDISSDGVVTVTLDSEPIDWRGKFPPTMSTENIRQSIEHDLYGQYVWDETLINDARPAPQITITNN